jgi:hypothetical protein
VADVRFKPDPVALANLLRGPNGPVARRALEDATLVKREAQRLVGKDTHALEHSIVTRVTVEGQRVVAYVGSEKPYALFHHEGTRAHPIEPVKAKVLRFTVGGAVVFAARVQHPGTRRNPYLVDALRVLRGRY